MALRVGADSANDLVFFFATESKVRSLKEKIIPVNAVEAPQY